jgi:hypothetical protein
MAVAASATAPDGIELIDEDNGRRILPSQLE